MARGQARAKSDGIHFISKHLMKHYGGQQMLSAVQSIRNNQSYKKLVEVVLDDLWAIPEALSPRHYQEVHPSTSAIPLAPFLWAGLQLSQNVQQHLSHRSLAKGPSRLILLGGVICGYSAHPTLPGIVCGYAWREKCINHLHQVAPN